MTTKLPQQNQALPQVKETKAKFKENPAQKMLKRATEGGRKYSLISDAPNK
ncbi:MAG: hypothetical protein ACRBCI_10110 [Cellvibrionaceae bacterium]